MHHRTYCVPTALALAGLLPAQYFEARNAAMGFSGVASSHYVAAGWANPALLTRCEPDDRFGFLLPTAGVVANDEDGLIEDIKDFVDELDRLEATTPTQPELDALAAQLQSLSGRQVTGNAGVGFAFAAPSRDFAWAVHGKTFADLQAIVDVDPADIAALQGGTIPGTFQSETRIIGVAISELGVSIAKGIDLGGAHLGLAVTPKAQRVDSYNYAVTADNYDGGDFDSEQYRNDGSAFNFDVGASLEPGMGLVFGAVVRNCIERDYTTVSTLGQQFVYEVNPTAALGAAWTIGMLTVTGDVELNPHARFRTSGPLLQDDDIQLAHLGAELDLISWLQLRAGWQGDIENTLDPTWTAGLGISPFGVFHLDVAGSYVSPESFGGVVQMGFTF